MPATTTAATAAAAPEAQPATAHPYDPGAYLTGDWGGVRHQLFDKGINFDIELTADGTKNLLGGLNTTDSVWRQMFEATVSLDTKPLLGIDGGTVFVDFQDARGTNASDDLVGDLQGIDGLDGVPRTKHQDRTQLAQLWYQQIAFDGLLRIKIGKVDANSEFDRSPAALEFVHQSTGSSATLFTLPTYPDPAMGINVFLKPSSDLQIGFGMYDGSLADGVTTGSLGPRTFFRNPSDLFFIAEIDKTWTVGPDHLAGRLGVGGWYSTNKFARLDGGTASGTGAPYALLDQAIWRANTADASDARGVGLFAMYGYADPTILQYDHNFGGGIAWTGPLPGRPADVIGAGFQSIHFSEDFHPNHSFETSYELFYKLQLQPWLSIKPDLQLITNPGGMRTPDALAFTLRFVMVF